MTERSDITLSAQGLSRRYGTSLAVDALALELKRGEVLGLLGPNGAGKTTTMQMLTGNLAPSSGEIRIGGADLLAQPKSAKAKLGYLPETPPLYREMTVDEFLGFCARLHRVPKAQVADAVQTAKARCGLTEMGRRLIAHLSKGYQQRVGIAQAIIHEPDVVILDEPTVGLDPIQIREIRALIRELGGKHSVILSTHILPEVEAVCDRVQIMHQGRIVFADSIEGLRRSRQSHSLIVGFSHPPSLDTLRALPGVKDAESLDGNLIRIHCAPDGHATEAISQAASAQGWGLTQLSPEAARLEDVFVALTQTESSAEPKEPPAA